MIDITKITARSLPKTAKLFECSDWFFTIREDWVIKIHINRKPDANKLASIQAEIEQLEEVIDTSKIDLEVEEATSKIRQLEYQFTRESATDYISNTSCVWLKSDSDVQKWIEMAGEAKQNSVWSVAYATGWRSQDASPESIISTPREWRYNWKDA